ncbi:MULTISPECIES: hypothetical protein [unclassified Kitasatospora]|uniref:hypothetical protein n=1 Tax=unclassified Kitasatospora TaxID=2633591 RepID=UPI002E36820E|nr:hypothetical protein [Kitasatospora sp. NBC_01246]
MPLGFHRKPTGLPGEWFYCIKHAKVEEGPECPAKDRLGPYASREEAAHALETAEERNREWKNDDERFDGRPTEG